MCVMREILKDVLKFEAACSRSKLASSSSQKEAEVRKLETFSLQTKADVFPARQNGDYGRNFTYFRLIFRQFSADGTPSAIFPPTCLRIPPIFRICSAHFPPTFRLTFRSFSCLAGLRTDFCFGAPAARVAYLLERWYTFSLLRWICDLRWMSSQR